MGSSSGKNLLLFFALLGSVLLFRNAECASEEDTLFQEINSYRASLNLSTLVQNSNAACLAKKLADQFKNQPCSNTSGADTVPGTEPQFSNYPDLLSTCHLNVSDTRDGAIMPACVPDLVPSLVLTNFTLTQYNENLNDTKFTGVGIGSNKNWIVVIMTTSTSEGDYLNAPSAGWFFRPDLICHSVFLLISALVFI
ncbi:hypothetical protein MLD38_018049 [Melastoma candidum]|uniref:Uncharacterized protein n=1 Tax=Melastoma candidum TaxID=119954 RepID=A0ACB9QUI4_9MYRT|nr:hypothetical protein MLD38_018049 [Melastoma candidum]